MNLFRTGDPRPIHFMGIAGAGMSALALIARHRGVAITGCDSDTSGAALDDLTTLGVRVWRGHDPSHVDGARAVTITARAPSTRLGSCPRQTRTHRRVRQASAHPEA